MVSIAPSFVAGAAFRTPRNADALSATAAQAGAAGLASDAPSSSSQASQSAGAYADQQLQNALQALKTLRQQTTTANGDQKAAAKQKLDALKAQLKALLEFGGDPKQRAREAAAIAKQIAAAAQEYAQAGGDPGPAAAPTEPSTTNASAPSSGGQTTSDRTASTDASGQNAAATSARTQSSATSNDASQNTPATGGGSSDADQQFIAEARTLAAQAKAIIQAAAQNLKNKHESLDSADARAGDDAVAAVQKAAEDLGGSAAGYAGAIPTPTTPTLSITA
jgi:hypothetical protein